MSDAQAVIPVIPPRPAKPLFQALALAFIARQNCEKQGNTEWFHRHTDRIEELVKQHMPSGSGFDDGTTIDLEKSKADRLVFNTQFHHMDEGSYTHWTSHTIIVTPSLAFGVDIRITGRNDNGIKDYMQDVFNNIADVSVT